MKPQKWSAGDAITAGRLNSMTSESLRSRNAEAVGPGSSMAGDNFGSSSANHQKPQAQLCIAVEDFKDNIYTDNYFALDKIPSGKCRLMRFNSTNGEYEEEAVFEPFRVWDPIAKLTSAKNKMEGDFFYAVFNKDNQRLEVLSAGAGVKIRHGLMVQCLGFGWYLIELMDSLGIEPPVEQESLSGSTSESDPGDPCSICDIPKLLPGCTDEDFLLKCGEGGIFDPLRPRKGVDTPCVPGLTGTGVFVAAYDKRVVPLKENGQVTVLFTGDRHIPGSESYDASSCSGSSCQPEDSWTILTGEYQLVKIPIEKWECCDGENVKRVMCRTVIVEGTECIGPSDSCDQSSSMSSGSSGSGDVPPGGGTGGGTPPGEL